MLMFTSLLHFLLCGTVIGKWNKSDPWACETDGAVGSNCLKYCTVDNSSQEWSNFDKDLLCNGYRNCPKDGRNDEDNCDNSVNVQVYKYYTKAGFYNFEEAWKECTDAGYELLAPRLETENRFLTMLKLKEKLFPFIPSRWDVWVALGIYKNGSTERLQYKGDEEPIARDDFFNVALEGFYKDNIDQINEKHIVQMNIKKGSWRVTDQWKSRIVCVDGYTYDDPTTITTATPGPPLTTPEPVIPEEDLEWCVYAIVGTAFMCMLNISYIVYTCVKNNCCEKQFIDEIAVDDLKVTEKHADDVTEQSESGVGIESSSFSSELN